MYEDLEKSWDQLSATEKDPYRLVDRQNKFLGSAANSAPQFVIDKCDEVYENAGRLEYSEGIVYCMGVRGYGYYMLSEYDKALPILHEGLLALGNMEKPHIQYRITGTIALAHISLGNFKKALEYGLQTRELIKQMGDRVQEGWTVQGFGLCYQEMGLLDEAMKAYEDCLAIFEEEGELNGIARAMTGIGTIFQEKGDYDQAAPYHEKSLSLFRQANNKSGEARALNDLGVIHQYRGDYEKSLALHEASLIIRQQIGNKQSQSTSYMNLGSLSYVQGNLDEAIRLFGTSLALAEEVGAKKKMYELHQLLARTYEDRQELGRAIYHYKAFYELRHEILNKQISVRINSLQATFDIEKAQKEAEIIREKNTELKEKNELLETLLSDLKTTQSQLLHAEKMASLGQLTAGIAHEIKNPLNFVNNFAALSSDLTQELKDYFETHRQETVSDVLEATQDLLQDLYFNASKINQHGQRADRIIQSMLEHARGNKGHKQQLDVNTILKEYLKLAYHGMRATDARFFAHIEENYVEDPPEMQGIPHDLGRVFLNLISNSFYAMAQKSLEAGAEYQPVLRIETRHEDAHIFVKIRDNGPGIPDAIQQNIFNPFFTTKPSGEGTGLGLSLSYEIINGEHNGELYLEDSSENGTSFVIKLPVYSDSAVNT